MSTTASTAITPLKFTGISTFSSDFQTILSRAVSIASLPISQLQNQQSDLISKKATLGDLGGSLRAFTSAVKDLGTLAEGKAITATSTNTTKVTVQATGSPAPGAYTISEITSIAKRSSETTTTGFATADKTQVDSDGKLQLVFGSQTADLDLTTYGNNLQGLQKAINASGLNVTASILNTGDPQTPYYLSINANSTGANALQLRTTKGDGASNILTANNQGANAVFKLNGLQVTKSDNTISDVVPGVTFNLLDTTAGDTITINVNTSRGTLATKLQAYVDSYNSVMSKVNQQIGKSAGLLSGDPIIGTIQRAVRQVSNYSTGSGSVRNLTELGISVDKTGVMTFDTTTFYSLPSNKIDGALSFIGSTSTGFGNMYHKVDEISNPLTGLIQQQQKSFDTTDANISKQINTIAARIQDMQLTLQDKLQKADTLLSQLQGQQNMLTTQIKSIESSTYGKSS